MKHLRQLALMLALLTVLSLTLAGCSNSGGEAPDPKALAKSILEEVNFEVELVEVAENAVENWYFLNDDVTAYAIYINGGTVPLEEVAVLVSETDSGRLQEVLDQRLEDLASLFENYNPGEMTKIDNPTIVTKGKVAVLVLSSDPDATKKVEELLK